MKRLLLSIGLVLMIALVHGQSLSELRQKKSEAEKQLRYNNTLLSEAQKNEKSSLSKIKLLKAQIKLRTAIIESIGQELEVMDWSIDNNEEIVAMLQSDLAQYKKEYAAMVRFAQKHKNSYDVLIFLFSAENVNQAYKRWLYLRHYATYRKNQVDQIKVVSNEVDERLLELKESKKQKTALLNNKLQEYKMLQQEESQQSSYVKQMQRQQRDLKKKIADQQKEQEELNRRIQKILEEEARKTADKTGFGLTPEQKIVSADFEKNKGRIPWPVERGIITEHFGIHSHPVLTQIKVKNNGVDISTSTGSKARAVFEGEVSRVFAISGSNMAVIIRHGSFLSVYSNLSEVTVKPGQKVAIKQEIGTIFTDSADDNTTVIKFQIWKENQKLDPEEWISMYK